MNSRPIGNIVLVICCVLAIVLQLLLSSALTIGLAMPNFIAAVIIACVLLSPSNQTIAFAFVAGLLYNLICGGPVGAMAFSLVLTSFICILLKNVLGQSSGFGTFVMIALTCLINEAIYGLVMVAFLSDVSFVEALVLRALPCAVYDFLLASVFYLLLGIVFGITSNRHTPEYR